MKGEAVMTRGTGEPGERFATTAERGDPVQMLRSVLASVGEGIVVYDAELRDSARAEEAYLRVLGLDAKDPDALEALDRIYE